MTDTTQQQDITPRTGQEVQPWRRFVGAMERRLRPLWVTALLVGVMFQAFRLALLLARLDALANVAAAEIAGCFLLGACYDAIGLGYLLLPLVLLVTIPPSRAFAYRGFRALVGVYATAVVIFVVIGEIIGAAFFLRFGLRLNWMALYYLQYPREVATFIYQNYPVWLLVPLSLALVYGSYRLFARLFWRAEPVAPVPRVARLASAAVLVTLCALGCRGGLGHRPLSRGKAYISYNNLVNQLTLNDAFTFFSAVKMKLTDNRDEMSWYPLPPAPDAAKATIGMLRQEGRDEFAGDPASPLWRRTNSHRPAADGYNVVMIVMESMAGKDVGALGYGSNCTPNFDALCGEGIYFDRMYAVGARTCRGIMATLCGHPDIGGETILKRPRAMGRFLTLPGVFRARGYETMFVYGGDPRFDNMKGFFRAHGIDTFIGQDEIGADQAGNWGVPDQLIFDAAHQAFVAMGDKKFFSVILTVSNHEPFNVPRETVPAEADIPWENDALLPAKIRNAYRYADWALGRYFRQAAGADYFKRTIFVLVADHGVRLDTRLILDVPGYRVPCLIYAPGVSTPIAAARRVSTICSQSDIPPTLLSLLGGGYSHCFMGRDILAVPPGQGFAFMHEDDRLGFLRGSDVLVVPPLSDPILFSMVGRDFQRVASHLAEHGRMHRLQSEMLSYYRMARELYLKSAYAAPFDAATGGPSLPSRAKTRPTSTSPGR